MTAPLEPTGVGAVAIRTLGGVTEVAVSAMRGAPLRWSVDWSWVTWDEWATIGDVEILHPGVPPEHLTRPAEPTEPGTIRDLIDSDGELVLRVMRTDTARSCNWKCSAEDELSWPDVCQYADRVHLTIVDPFATAGGAS